MTGFDACDEHRVELGRLGDVASARTARRRACEFLDAHGLGDLSDDVALVVSELVTNAIVHAHEEPVLKLRHRGRSVVVEVADPSPAEEVRVAASPDPIGGWGLRLVESLATRWGVRPDPQGGKTVWAEFDVDRSSHPRISEPGTPGGGSDM
jgi:anti-sigma regulatory factor (Ser/Thr protein kinase)